MRKRIIKTAFLVILTVLVGACSDNNPPSDTLSDYTRSTEKEEALSALYFYPTTVRMLEKVMSQSGETGILSGVKSGRIIYGVDDSLDVLKADFDELSHGLKDEGFELLGEFKSGSDRTVAYVREGKTKRYVALLASEASTILVELYGELSIETIRGLSQLNTDNVMSLFDLPSPDKSNPEDTDEGEKANESENEEE